jgi:hypothetical protein
MSKLLFNFISIGLLRTSKVGFFGIRLPYAFSVPEKSFG